MPSPGVADQRAPGQTPMTTHSVELTQIPTGSRRAAQDPAAVYTAGLAAGLGRTSQVTALRAVARLAGVPAETMPWAELRFKHVTAILEDGTL